MNEERKSSISELWADHSAITEAIGRGVREAILRHAQTGQAVVSWENGKVVWIAPEEILARFGQRKAS